MNSQFRSVRARTLFSIMLLCGCLLSMQPSRAKAADGNGIQIGLLTGAGLVNGVVSFTYGFAVDYRYGNNFIFGVNYTALGLGIPSGFLSGYSASASVTSFLGEALYRFTDFLVGTYLVAKAGIVFSAASLTGAAVSVTPSTANLAFGGGVGYLFQPGDKFTIGPEMSIILNPGSDITLVNLLARVNYKF